MVARFFSLFHQPREAAASTEDSPPEGGVRTQQADATNLRPDEATDQPKADSLSHEVQEPIAATVAVSAVQRQSESLAASRTGLRDAYRAQIRAKRAFQLAWTMAEWRRVVAEIKGPKHGEPRLLEQPLASSSSLLLPAMAACAIGVVAMQCGTQRRRKPCPA